MIWHIMLKSSSSLLVLLLLGLEFENVQVLMPDFLLKAWGMETQSEMKFRRRFQRRLKGSSMMVTPYSPPPSPMRHLTPSFCIPKDNRSSSPTASPMAATAR